MNTNKLLGPNGPDHTAHSKILTPLLLTLMLVLPLAAQAQDLSPVSGALNSIHSFLQSTAMRTLAAIAVIGLGITAMMGRLRWAWAASVIGGIVIIFGADAFVSFFTSSSSSGG